MTQNPPPGLSLPKIPQHVARQAVQWLVELQSGDADDATRAGLQRWLDQHPDHQAAWQHIQTINRRLAGLGEVGGNASVHAALAPRAAAAARRRAIKTLLLMAGVGAGSWLAYARPWQDAGDVMASGVGERRTLVLEEGTRVVLGTDTRIQVQYGASERRITLLQGEIMVTTAPDRATPARRLLVATAHGEVQALGTVYAVRDAGALTQVQVFRDRVRMLPRTAPEASLLLQAGQQALLTPLQACSVQALPAGAGAWADGMLVAADMRLADFVAELRRYRRGHLDFDPALAGLRVSGTYLLDDTEGILQALAASQPLEVRHFTRYWTTLVPRPRG